MHNHFSKHQGASYCSTISFCIQGAISWRFWPNSLLAAAVCMVPHAPFFRPVKQCSYSYRAQGNGKGRRDRSALAVGRITASLCLHSLSPQKLISCNQQTDRENRESLLTPLLYCSLLWWQQCCLTVLCHGVWEVFPVLSYTAIKLTSQTHCKSSENTLEICEIVLSVGKHLTCIYQIPLLLSANA